MTTICFPRRPERLEASRRLRCCALLLSVFLASGAALAEVEFPGPLNIPLPENGQAATKVRFPGRTTDDLVVGADGGSIRLLRYLDISRSVTVLGRELVGGAVVDVIDWEALPLLERGVAVAVRDPDQVVLISLVPEFPYLITVAAVALPEDPGSLAFVGDVLAGDGRLAVSLPGIDEVALLSPDGGWHLERRLPTGDRPAAIAGADLEADGRRELILAQNGFLSEDLGVYRLDGADQWVLEQVSVPGVVPLDLLAEDTDADGTSELLVLDREAPRAVVLDAGGGSLVVTEEITLTARADRLVPVKLADGTAATATQSRTRGLVEFHGRVDGTWTRFDSYYAGCRPAAGTAADLNGDGRPELVNLAGDTADMTILVGHSGPGVWGFPALALTANPGSYVLTDVDGDGDGDLVVAGADAMALTVFAGAPDGTLAPDGVDHALPFFPGRLRAADVDGDGRSEVLVTEALPGSIVRLEFEPGAGFTVGGRTTVGPFPSFFALSDLDGDGWQDAMVLTPSLQGVVVVFGDGAGGFVDRADVPTTVDAEAVAAVDVDADGLRDLVISDGASRIWTVPGRAGRVFGSGAWYNAGSGATDLAVGDLDGDGDDDVVVGNRTEHSLSFFENSGSGLVRRIGGHALSGSPRGLVVADFDLDGRADVVANQPEDAVLGLVLNTGAWTYNLPRDIRGTPSMVDIGIMDPNRDGVPDLFALDRVLRLGFTLLNVEQSLVAVEPTALTAGCVADGWVLRVRPDRPGPWRLDLLAGAGPVMVAAGDEAGLGAVEVDGGSWVVNLAAAAVDSRGGMPVVRLTVGIGADEESIAMSLPGDCAGTQPPTGLRWSREPWPNPFNPSVQAEFSLRQSGSVRAGVFDLRGRRVAALHDGPLAAGDHVLVWDGRGEAGAAAAGTYFLRIETGEGTLGRKILLLK